METSITDYVYGKVYTEWLDPGWLEGAILG